MSRWATARWAVVAVAAAVLAAACSLSVGGLLDSRPWGDVGHYEVLAERAVGGEIPYRDYYVEYPPGALPVFLAPEGAGGGYLTAFKLQMAACAGAALIALALALGLLRASRRRLAWSLLAFALVPAALGHLFLNRYDIWPAALATFGVAALLARRDALAGVLLGGAFAAKLFVAAALPVAALHVLRNRGPRALVVLVGSGSAVVVAAFLPFALLAPGGVGFSVYSQATRGLHAESLAGSALLALDSLGLYDARLVAGLGIELEGTLPDVLGAVGGLVQLAAVAAVVLAYRRHDATDERLVTAFAASVAAFLVFAKVISPQFLVWLAPLVPLVAGASGLAAGAVFLVACLASQLEVHGFEGLSVADWAVATLVARNVLLVALFVLLLRALTRLPHARAALPGALRAGPG